ncbi:MAG: DUF2231 domain-containing protein [Rhodothermales bacterium]
MDIIPDWAPNIHPLLVHFPIALLFAAVLLDLAALLFREHEGLRVSTVVVYVMGALGALASYLTGKHAGDSLMLPAEANTVLTDHADWAAWTVWFFGIYALVRLGALWKNREGKLAVRVPLWLIGAGGLFLVVETAEHGAQMVFEYGVGVQAVETLEATIREQQAELDRSHAREAGPVVAENGSWRWLPGEYAAESLAESFTWLAGDADSLRLEAMPDEERGYVLALHTQNAPAFFVFDQPLGSIQADVTLNVDDFGGMLMIVHHVQDAGTYGFLALENGTIRQGSVRNGTVDRMDEKPFDGTGWQQLRVVGDKTHFRGYAGGLLITHGHGSAFNPGAVGLRIDGSGTLRLGRIDVQELR